MRKLVFILIAFAAAATFIRAFDNAGDAASPFPAGSFGQVEGYAVPGGVPADVPDLDYETR